MNIPQLGWKERKKERKKEGKSEWENGFNRKKLREENDVEGVDTVNSIFSWSKGRRSVVLLEIRG